MGINVNDIITALNLKQKEYSQLESIILEYGSLIQKMNNLEQQSWFFKKAEENNYQKIKDLKNEFEKIRTNFRSSSIDDLIVALKNEKHNKISIQRKKYINTNDSIAIASLSSNITYIEELLEIKSRVVEIKEMDYYLENKEQLIKLLGWKAL
mgnify:CR=1 FL=1|tara:strand:+ start:87 stop:545 length:459 start_codon:yes stop_codon:yes gene_type:complete